MLGPKNKILDKKFLLSFIDCLKNTQDANLEETKHVYRWGDYYDKYDTKKFYDSFLQQKKIITYNGENFQILSFALSNKKAVLVNRTYKDKWKQCDTIQPYILKAFETYHYSCEDYNENDDEEDDESEKDKYIEIYSVNKFLKDYANKLSFNGTYYSQPGQYYPITGAQYYWNLIFNYHEFIDGNPIDIIVKLGPVTRHIFRKYVAYYGCE